MISVHVYKKNEPKKVFTVVDTFEVSAQSISEFHSELKKDFPQSTIFIVINNV